MGDSWDLVGTFEWASTRRSFVIRDASGSRIGYVSLKKVVDMINGHGKSTTVWKPKKP